MRSVYQGKLAGVRASLAAYLSAPSPDDLVFVEDASNGVQQRKRDGFRMAMIEFAEWDQNDIRISRFFAQECSMKNFNVHYE